MEFNVLIVDDSKTIRSVVMRVIGMSGVPVAEYLEAENGAEALEMVRSKKIDIILTDINMPVMDGLQFLEELKKDPEIKNIPVIMVSTEASETKITKAVRLGAEGYIKKPFVPETIREIMLKILDKKYGYVPGDDAVAGGDDDDSDF